MKLIMPGNILSSSTLTIPNYSIYMGAGFVYLTYFHHIGNESYKSNCDDESIALVVCFIVFTCFVFWLLTKQSKKQKKI